MKSKNILFYILLVLLLTTVVSIVMGYHTFGFGVGFLFAFLSLSTGYFYSMKNREYMHQNYHADYVDRLKNDKKI
ncbi:MULTISPECIES: hypothetical protein [Cytobacillus]|uniref:Uncharacterized protein n=3 Tax=Cytobacillus TaxID=2675230 RepID=A0A160M7J8_9BACI|nr:MULTISPECIES: hypothetical protein [Cytobacillus]EFV75420.1 hypothetical protein HMPREF1013_04198 [Bacillus sp. 2_A_57_CT2]AND38506.1 hypothetical protein A361_05015 [Cytobacillus oceanisediminis 2691]MBG9542818.1 hypothetical protein [Cytobacillus firmus]MBG9548893.1 hypothetical protein [Cytobacillus firmus]MBG9554299.1 hypothetical protein [Cytobacillus firmus]